MTDNETTRTAVNKAAGLKRLASSHWVLGAEHDKAAEAVAKVLEPYKKRAIKARNKYRNNTKDT